MKKQYIKIFFIVLLYFKWFCITATNKILLMTEAHLISYRLIHIMLEEKEMEEIHRLSNMFPCLTMTWQC